MSKSKKIQVPVKGKTLDVDTNKGVGAALKQAMPEVQEWTYNSLAQAAQKLGMSMSRLEQALIGVGQDPAAEMQARIAARTEAGQDPDKDVQARLKARK